MTATSTLERTSTTALGTAGETVPAQADWLVVWNPAAGNGSSRSWRRYERELRTAGVYPDVVRTAAAGDAARIAFEAVREGRRRLMVAGGDGSAHEVVNGVMQAVVEEPASGPHGTGGSRLPPLIVPVPLGTGNDWARSLGLPRDPSRFATVVSRDHRIELHDVGHMRFAAAPTVPRWFVNVAGAGLDADVIAALSPRVPSRFAYLAHALRRLGRYRAPTFRIEGPGWATVDRQLLLAFVAIGQYCGHAMRVAPTARYDDGLFDVVTIDRIGLVRAVPKLAKLYLGTLLDDPVVTHRRTVAVRIEAVPPAPVEADGQLVGTTPVEFAVVPAALRVLRAA